MRDFSIFGNALSQDAVTDLYNNVNSYGDLFESSSNLSVEEANSVIEEVFTQDLGQSIDIKTNQKVYTSYLSGETNELTFNKYVSYNNKRYAILYSEDALGTMNSIGDSFNVLLTQTMTEQTFRDELLNLINSTQ